MEGDLKCRFGIYVHEIRPNSITEKDGRLKKWDRILAINDQPIEDFCIEKVCGILLGLKTQKNVFLNVSRKLEFFETQPIAGASGTQKMASEPRAMASGPSEVASGPTDIGSEPFAMASEIQKVSFELKKMMYGSQEGASGPTEEVSSEPSGTASEPTAMASGPQEVASGPKETVSGPPEVASGPKAGASSKQTASENWSIWSFEPQSIALLSGTQKLASESKDMVSGLKEMASEPKELASGPKESASEPKYEASSPIARASTLSKVSLKLGFNDTFIETVSAPLNKQHEPKAMAFGSQKAASKPKDLASGSPQKASESKVMASGLQAVASKPKDLASGSPKVASEPKVMASGFQAVASKPKDLASVPKKVQKHKESKSFALGSQYRDLRRKYKELQKKNSKDKKNLKIKDALKKIDRENSIINSVAIFIGLVLMLASSYQMVSSLKDQLKANSETIFDLKNQLNHLEGNSDVFKWQLKTDGDGYKMLENKEAGTLQVRH